MSAVVDTNIFKTETGVATILEVVAESAPVVPSIMAIACPLRWVIEGGVNIVYLQLNLSSTKCKTVFSSILVVEDEPRCYSMLLQYST